MSNNNQTQVFAFFPEVLSSDDSSHCDCLDNTMRSIEKLRDASEGETRKRLNMYAKAVGEVIEKTTNLRGNKKSEKENINDALNVQITKYNKEEDKMLKAGAGKNDPCLQCVTATKNFLKEAKDDLNLEGTPQVLGKRHIEGVNYAHTENYEE